MQSKSAFQLFIALFSLITFSPIIRAQDDSLKLKNDSVVIGAEVSGKTSAKGDSLKIDSTKSSELSPDAIKSKIEYKARDTVRYDLEHSKIYLFGEAVVKYEDVELTADYIEVNMDSNMVRARGVTDSLGKTRGSPVFKDGQQEFKSQRMNYNFQTKKGKIYEVITQDGEGYIHGEAVKKTEDDIVYISNGRYTTCDHEHPHFYIASRQLKVIPNDKIVARPANLVIEDVPTPLVVPFGIFPNRDHGKSGIIIPAPGESPSQGFYLWNAGYYFYLGEKSELTITSDIYTNGSYAVKPIYSYKKRYRRSGVLDLMYKNTRNGVIREDPDFSETKAWWLKWNHTQEQQARPNSNFGANVNLGATDYFKNDYNTSDNDYLRSTFYSKISYSKYTLRKKLNLSTNAIYDQSNSQGNSVITLPDATINLTRIYPFSSRKSFESRWYDRIGTSYSGTFRNNLRIKTDDITVENRDSIASSFENGMRHSIPVSTNFKVLKYFSLNPSFNYNELWYFKTLEKSYNPTDSSIEDEDIPGFARGANVGASVSLTTKLYGMLQSTGGFFRALRHVMTPSVSFSYTPENRQGLVSYTDTGGNQVEYSKFQKGIFGTPNTTESGKIGLGLLNSFEMKVRTKSDTADGIKKIKLIENLSIRSGYDMIRDSLKWDNISISGFTSLSKFLTLNFGSTFDVYALDSSGTTSYRINQYEWDLNNRLARLTSANISFGLKLSSNPSKAEQNRPKNSISGRPDPRDLDFDVPWNLNVLYSIDYARPQYEANTSQSMNASGDLSITRNWKITFNTYWDFILNKISYTSLGISRDLHCWVMSMNWVPIGQRENYTFNISVKANILKDSLKLEKKDIN